MGYWKLGAFAFAVFWILLAGCQSPDELPRVTTPPEQASAKDTQVHPTVSTVASEGQDGPWDVVRQMQVEHKATFAAFANEEFGITGCGDHDQPYVYYSSNGGQTWTRSESDLG